MRSVIYLFSLNLLLAMTGCQSAQQAENRLVLAFGEAMFPAELTGGHTVESVPGDTPHLTRWPSDVRASMMAGGTPDMAAATHAVLEEFAALSGVSVVWLAPGDDSANLRIYFSEENDFLINGNELATCYSSIRSNRDWTIARASVFVGMDKETGAHQDCFTHELLHAFGWRGHTHRVRSANSYAHDETRLTRWDRILMRTQYDPRLAAGTPKADALPVARVIIRELMKD
jgi:hypothetical protein